MSGYYQCWRATLRLWTWSRSALLAAGLLIAALSWPSVVRCMAYRHLLHHGAFFDHGMNGPAWTQWLGGLYPAALIKYETLNCSNLSPCSFASVRHFPEVKTIILNGTIWFGDDECAYFLELPELRSLQLAGCRITDTGVARIARCESLEMLYLEGTPVSDASVSLLVRLSQLQELSVKRTRMTGDGVRRLVRSMSPDCIVDAEYPTEDES